MSSGAFTQGGRKEHDLRSLRAFYVDIDAKNFSALPGAPTTAAVQLRKMNGWEDTKIVLATRAAANGAGPAGDRDSAANSGNAGRTRAAA